MAAACRRGCFARSAVSTQADAAARKACPQQERELICGLSGSSLKISCPKDFQPARFSPTCRHLEGAKTWGLCVLLLLSGVGIAAVGEEAKSPQRFSRTERHMGADFTVKLYANSEEAAERAFKAAFDLVAEYDRLMSDYNSESELSQLGRQSPTTSPVPVSKPIWEVLSRAQQFSEQTGGAFDVTAGPLTKIWRRAKRQRELPTDEERQEALAAVGWTHLVLDRDQQAVALTRPNMRLDLGGIAPGYAADQVLAKLRELGIKSALADASGDVAFGDAPPGQGWQVGLAPLKAEGPPEQILLLANCAISTSGDAFRGVEIGGVRYSHIVDPKTGVGLKHRSSVTVIAPNCTTADALATALSVLGPKHGLEVLKHFPDAEARMVWQDEKGEVHSTESEKFPQGMGAGYPTSPRSNASP